MNRIGLCIICCVLLLGGAKAQHSSAAFEENDCPFLVIAPEVEGETIVCGLLSVPENRAHPGRQTFELQVAIVKGVAGATGEPLVYLEGGPGGAAVMSVPDVWVSSGLRGRGDIIVVDQRGTGYSWPSLDCVALVDEESEDPVAECRDALVAEGIDLNAFNSRESAADVADLLRALEIEQASLYGVSYGTRLALTVIRDHPQRVRSVILDGVYPLQVQALELQTTFGNRAFEVLFADCRAVPACDSEYPELRQVFFDLVDDLEEKPLVDDDGGEIYGDDLVNEIFHLMYDTAAIPYLPRLIYEAFENGVDGYLQVLDEISEADVTAGIDEDSTELEAALDERLLDIFGLDEIDELHEHLGGLDEEELDYWLAVASGEINESSDGVFNSVECQEEVPFNDPDVASDLSHGLPEQVGVALLVDVMNQFEDCEIWDVRVAGSEENEPVISDIPTLLLSGNYDPITPPSWGEEAARYLSNSYHFVFPAMGHGTIDVHECPTSIALAFLENPLAMPDDGCLAEMGPPAFR